MLTENTETPYFHHHVTGECIPMDLVPAPCPFCGRIAFGGIVTCGEGSPDATHHVQCDCCGAEGPSSSSLVEAAESWNRANRATDCFSQIEDIREQKGCDAAVIEDASYILRFLSIATPIPGVEYAGDDRLKHGEQLICGYVAELLTDRESPPRVRDHDLYECAEVLYFLHNITAIKGHSFSDGSEEAAGFTLVLEWIERRILRASGVGRRRAHWTFGEKFNEARKSNPEGNLEQIYEKAAGKPLPDSTITLIKAQRGEAA